MGFEKRLFRMHVGMGAGKAHVVNPVAEFAGEQVLKKVGVGELFVPRGG